MFTQPEDLPNDAVVETLLRGWGLVPIEIIYAAVGFGSHHWNVVVDDSKLFVVAPIPSLAGSVVEHVDDHYVLAVYPHIDGHVGSFGRYATQAERFAVIGRLIEIHAATETVETIAGVDDFTIPTRDRLVATLADTTEPWHTGPYAERTRTLLDQHAGAVITALNRYDDLVALARRHGAERVVTHGEPHRGNEIFTAAGALLIDWDTALLAPRERDLWSLAAHRLNRHADRMAGARAAPGPEPLGRSELSPTFPWTCSVYRVRATGVLPVSVTMGVVDLGLDGQNIIVTGGSSGIGLAAARLLLDEGAMVTICGRSADRLDQAAAHLDSANLCTVQADVLDAESAARVIDSAVLHGGRLDGVAAVAGQGRHGSLLAMDSNDIVAEVSDKLLGFLNVARPAISHLAATRGCIVGLTAPTARQPSTAMAAISVGRAALDNAINGLALELAPQGIRVNAVGVGLIDTARQHARHDETGAVIPYPQWLDGQAQQRGVPLARAGTATEVAAAICWMLSPVSSYTTGAVLDVTGGHRSR